MKNKIAKLIDFKNIITFMLLCAFTYGFIVNKVDSNDFIIVVMLTMNFYFTKDVKKEDKED